MPDRLAEQARVIADGLPLVDVDRPERCPCGAELPRRDHTVDRAHRCLTETGGADAEL